MPLGFVAETAVYNLGPFWAIWAKTNFGPDIEGPGCGLSSKESFHCHLVSQVHIAWLCTISGQTPKGLKQVWGETGPREAQCLGSLPKLPTCP